MSFKHFSASLALALLATSAYAQSNNVNQIVDVSLVDDAGTAAFSALHSVGSGAFTDTFTFNVAGDYSAESVLSSIKLDAASNIDFTSATLNGKPYTVVKSGDVEVLQLNPVNVSGPLTLVVNGLAATNATYSGTLNLAAIPEPSTWVILAAGMALVGVSLRRR